MALSELLCRAKAGSASLQEVADKLNTLGIKTARRDLLYTGTVRNIVTREDQIEVKAA